MKYSRALFLLSKSLLFLCERNFSSANPLLGEFFSPLIEGWLVTHTQALGSSMASQQKEYLQFFYPTL